VTPIESPVALPMGVRLVRGRWITLIGGLFTGSTRPAAAVTMRNTIVVDRDVVISARLVRHELEHVRQWRAEGWMFPLRYAVQFVRHGYSANPYEIAARAAESVADCES
jgi:hypothetical protein